MCPVFGSTTVIITTAGGPPRYNVNTGQIRKKEDYPMIELPEAYAISGQINHTLRGKRIQSVIANQSPHKFAWFSGDPASYHDRLYGKIIQEAGACGGQVEIQVEDWKLVLSTNLRYHPLGEKRPKKHQLLLEFEDGSGLSASVQMWGALFCVREGESLNFIEYEQAQYKPSPLIDQFDLEYFDNLLDEKTWKLSAKAFLATEQRIPGLGNGVLQDILWRAQIHPRRKMSDLSREEIVSLFYAVKKVLKEMVDSCGRDTERDLFGCPGGYLTILSKNTAGCPCPTCGTTIRKEAYMGGSIYYCTECQKV
jgi:formamidopyrimidine-DNA glycosylase